MLRNISKFAGLVGVGLAGAAHAFNPFTWSVDEIYSNADGSVQFIMLSTSIRGDPPPGGHTLVASNGTETHSFTFPVFSDYPKAPVILIGTQSFADLKLVAPDFIVPDGFVFLTPGFVRLDSNVNSNSTSYSALPADDVTAFWSGYNDDDGFFQFTAPAVATNSSGAHLTFGPGVSGINALIEYHSSALDDYFLTALPYEIEALDSGTSPGWKRTGYSVLAWTSPVVTGQSPPDDLTPVCRIYIPPVDGDSHFYSVSRVECSGFPTLHPEVFFETDAAFFATLPNLQTGTCSSGQAPMYQLWNPRGSSHRYTTQPEVRDDMQSRGYIAEGYGESSVAMCVGGHK
jgi:hypothetical protein